MVSPKTALLVVDVQNDFCPGGALGVPRGDEVVAPLNRAIRSFRRARRPVVFSRDWHPQRTKHFREFGGMWPPHCLQGTEGAAFHPDLEVPRTPTIVSKGMDPEVDAYSCFQGLMADGQSFVGWLEKEGIQRLVIGGLATDYCVVRTTADARRLGYEVVVLEDAIRAVDLAPGDGDRAIAEMRRAGGTIAAAAKVLAARRGTAPRSRRISP